MNHHAYQWRPIRGRRFDSGRLLGTLLCAVSAGLTIGAAWCIAPFIAEVLR